MRSVQRVAQQDDVLVAPIPIPYQREIYPADEIVGQKLTPAEIVFKNTLQIRARFGFVFIIEFRVAPRLLTALDDECASGLVKLVRMRDEMTRLVFAEGQRQPVKQLIRTQTDVFVIPHVNRGLEEILISAAHSAVGPVSADHQIAVAIRLDFGRVSMESQIDADLSASLAQYAQESQPTDPPTPVAANRDPLAVVNNGDVVPDFACPDDP